MGAVRVIRCSRYTVSMMHCGVAIGVHCVGCGKSEQQRTPRQGLPKQRRQRGETWRMPTVASLGQSVGGGMLGAFLGVARSGWVLRNVGPKWREILYISHLRAT